MLLFIAGGVGGFVIGFVTAAMLAANERSKP